MSGRLENLQAIRGAACLLVVITHLAEFEGMFHLKFSPARPALYVGHIAIEMLFVVSGFVLTYIHLGPNRKPVGLPTYLFRRAWRVFPTYWVAIGTAIAIYTVCVPSVPLFPSNWKERLIDSMFLLPQPGPPAYLPVAWTMVYEVQFYIAFGLFLCVPRSIGKAAAFGWAGAIVGALVAGFRPESLFVAQLLSPFNLDLMAGCVVAWALARSRVYPLTAAALGAAWYAVSFALTYNPEIPRAMIDGPTNRVLFLGLPATLFVYALAGIERRGLRAPRLCGWFGDRSYSIYLLHDVALFSFFYLSMAGNLSHTRSRHVLWLVMMFGSSVGIGCLFYGLVERPIMNLMRKKKPAAKAAPLAPTFVPMPARRAA